MHTISVFQIHEILSVDSQANCKNCCHQMAWQNLRLKCTKFKIGWGSAPDPTGGAYSAPPDPLAGFKGPTSSSSSSSS